VPCGDCSLTRDIIEDAPVSELAGVYIGGAEELADRPGHDVEPNPERGRCSLSPA